MSHSTGQKAVLLVGGIAVLIPVALYLKRKFIDTRRLSIAQMVDPAAGKPIADSIAAQIRDPSMRVLAAWKFVGEGVEYENVGSLLRFHDAYVSCELCLLPSQVLQRGKANCVGKSLLLASILRNWYGPNDVFVAVGDVREGADIQGQTGGHAWVVVRLNGRWDLLEATSPPVNWALAPAKTDQYETGILFNDKQVMCEDPEMCVTIQKSRCLPCLLAA